MTEDLPDNLEIFAMQKQVNYWIKLLMVIRLFRAIFYTELS